MIFMAKPLSSESKVFCLLAHLSLTHVPRCEHYSLQLGGTQDHLFSYEAGTGLYNTEYLEALFDEDMEEITWIENVAYNAGFGPLASCSTIWNPSSIKVQCCKSILPPTSLFV